LEREAFEQQDIEQGITNLEGKLHDSTSLAPYSIFVFEFSNIFGGIFKGP
jgi:hypothetical protein